jgi:hypothetical protein
MCEEFSRTKGDQQLTDELRILHDGISRTVNVKAATEMASQVRHRAAELSQRRTRRK